MRKRWIKSGTDPKPSGRSPRNFMIKLFTDMETDMKFTPEFIPKEEVDRCKFPNEEVLKDQQSVAERRKMLERATSMGNTDHTKFKIIFEDDQGPKQIETTIWATGDKNISIKHGKTIPIHRIHELRIV